jgi:hypothetical protein
VKYKTRRINQDGKKKKPKNESQVLKQSISEEYNGEALRIKNVPEMVIILT